ncbi:MAG TPA: hypothetical protein VGY55_19545 [Pirellulales bacterium]|nr:hypothetical protein [Pirellulales bacterium]
MSSRFVYKVRREVATNPKKAIVLAIGSVVALWFWAPLAAKWFGKPELNPKTAKAPATAAIKSSAAPASGNQPAVTAGTTVSIGNGQNPTRPWRQLVTWMEQDPRMAPATELGIGRDPFASSRNELIRANPPRATPGDAELSPADAGIVLISTIVGLGKRMALIGKEVFEEGDLIPALHGAGSFRLVEIRPREIVLERKGKQYRLALPGDELASNGDRKPSRDVRLNDDKSRRGGN